jgi:adenylate kinase
MKPLVPGVCDKCSGPLLHRADDYEDVVRERLRLFHEKTAPLKQFYSTRGLVVTHDVKRGRHDAPEVVALLQRGVEERRR